MFAVMMHVESPQGEKPQSANRNSKNEAVDYGAQGQHLHNFNWDPKRFANSLRIIVYFTGRVRQMIEGKEEAKGGLRRGLST
jgi:hypothetical protein